MQLTPFSLILYLLNTYFHKTVDPIESNILAHAEPGYSKMMQRMFHCHPSFNIKVTLRQEKYHTFFYGAQSAFSQW